MINKLLEHNGVSLGDKLPSNMKVPFTEEEIQKQFKFHNPPRNKGADLASKMLNSYFNASIYNIAGKNKDGVYLQEKINGFSMLKYNTAKKYKKNIDFAIEFLAVNTDEKLEECIL